MNDSFQAGDSVATARAPVVPLATNPRILVIDDNRGIHDDFRKILTPSGATPGALAADAAALFDEAPAAAYRPPFQIDSAFQGQEGYALVQQALRRQQPYAVAFVD